MNICVDWLTFTVKTDEDPEQFANKLMPMLRYQSDGWKYAGRRYTWLERLEYEGIEILFNSLEGSITEGLIGVNISGKGCRTWEDKHGNIDSLLKLAYDIAYNITRIDLAVDDKEGKLDIDKIYELSGLRFNKNGELSDKCYWWGAVKNSERVQGSKGTTLYYGSECSMMRVRIYDKAAQLGIDEHWVRVELVLRSEKALQAVMMIQNGKPAGELFNELMINLLFSLACQRLILTSRTLAGILKIIFATGG